jgi:hypothetical protein
MMPFEALVDAFEQAGFTLEQASLEFGDSRQGRIR